ncbi:MAG: amidase, partial [Rhodospirillaceae bacterium]|nr:amidase [Rhodospirillaceae bacterium]
RIPASMTGTVGFKPSQGRWSKDCVVPLSTTLDCVGSLTRTVADAASFFAAIDPACEDSRAFPPHRPARGVAGLRIGVLACQGWDEAPGDIAECVHAALAELEQAGARLVDIAMPEYDAAGALYRQSTIAPIECGAFLAAELPDWFDLLHETTARRIQECADFPVRDYLLTLREMDRLARLVDEPLRAVDALATPTVAMSPPALAEVTEIEAYMQAMPRSGYATAPVNILGLCALSVPVGLDASGLPVGLQLIGRAGSDEALLEAGVSVEATLGTARQRLGRAPLGAH